MEQLPFLARLCRLNHFLGLVRDETLKAQGKYPPMNSHHEAYSVMLEELEEYWEEVRKKPFARDPAGMGAELIQLAAMCARTFAELCYAEIEAKPAPYQRGLIPHEEGPVETAAVGAIGACNATRLDQGGVRPAVIAGVPIEDLAAVCGAESTIDKD